MISFPPDTVMEDFTRDTFRSWRVGHAGRDNGIILFIFVQDRKIRIEVGCDLAKCLPDKAAKHIIDKDIVPRFRTGDFSGGIQAALNSIMNATRDTYRGRDKQPQKRQQVNVNITATSPQKRLCPLTEQDLHGRQPT